MFKLTKKELNELKREIKKIDNINIKDIEEIKVFNNNFVVYGYYENKYNKVINNMTYKKVLIKKY